MPPPWARRSALLGVFCLIPLLNFPRALLSERALFLRDISMVWAPQSEAVVQQIGRGEFPFFDARRAFGQPLYADPRSEVLYPPAWIHLLVTPDKSYAWFAAFHLVIAAMGAARLARRLLPRASLSALATAGLAYGASGPLLSLVSHWHHLAGAAWMPWIIECAEPRPGKPVRWLGLSGLVALQVFAGSPDYTFTTFVLCLLRIVTRAEEPGVGRFRAVPALFLGLCLGAVQLIPSLAFARDAAREPLPVGWAISPLHPTLTIETILPVRVESWPLRPEARRALLGDEQAWMLSHYLGLSVWGLAAIGLAGASRPDRRFLAGCILLGLFLSWGVRDESLQRLVAQLPLVAGLRFPTKHLVAASLGLSILAAHGVLTPGPRKAGSAVRMGVAVLVILLLCALLFVWSTESRAPFEVRALVEPAISLLALGAVLLALRGPSGVAGLLPAVVALDLLCAHVPLNPTTPSSFFRDRPPLTLAIPKGSRIYVSDYSIQLRDGSIRTPPGPPYRLANVPAGHGRAEATALAATWYLNPPSAGRWGYLGSFDLDVLDFYRLSLKQTIETFARSRDPQFVARSLQKGSVDYVVTMDAPGFWEALPLVAEEKRFFEDTVRVYKVPDPWPRARFETAEGGLDEGSPVVVSHADARIVITAETPKPTRLVLAIANDRGWRALVDGRPSEILDHGMAFLAVPLTKGSHVVALTYRPPWLAAGLVVSVVSGLVALLLAGRARGLGGAGGGPLARPGG